MLLLLPTFPLLMDPYLHPHLPPRRLVRLMPLCLFCLTRLELMVLSNDNNLDHILLTLIHILIPLMMTRTISLRIILTHSNTRDRGCEWSSPSMDSIKY